MFNFKPSTCIFSKRFEEVVVKTTEKPKRLPVFLVRSSQLLFCFLVPNQPWYCLLNKKTPVFLFQEKNQPGPFLYKNQQAIKPALPVPHKCCRWSPPTAEGPVYPSSQSQLLVVALQRPWTHFCSHLPKGTPQVSEPQPSCSAVERDAVIWGFRSRSLWHFSRDWITAVSQWFWLYFTVRFEGCYKDQFGFGKCRGGHVGRTMMFPGRSCSIWRCICAMMPVLPVGRIAWRAELLAFGMDIVNLQSTDVVCMTSWLAYRWLKNETQETSRRVQKSKKKKEVEE